MIWFVMLLCFTACLWSGQTLQFQCLSKILVREKNNKNSMVIISPKIWIRDYKHQIFPEKESRLHLILASIWHWTSKIAVDLFLKHFALSLLTNTQVVCNQNGFSEHHMWKGATLNNENGGLKEAQCSNYGICVSYLHNWGSISLKKREGMLIRKYLSGYGLSWLSSTPEMYQLLRYNLLLKLSNCNYEINQIDWGLLKISCRL